MEFAEVREYQPGDEVRSIDWNVTARMGRPFVKRYIEERELTVMLAVDLSGSERFGTRGRFKSELASELAAVLAMSAIRNNDRVGAVLFTDRIEHVVPPRKGRRHALRLMRDLLVFEPEGSRTDLAGALEYTGKMLAHKSIIFVVSDFQAADIEHPLKLLAQRHDVVAVTVDDPSERTLPDIGLARFVDPETGTTLDVDTSDPDVRAQFADAVEEELIGAPAAAAPPGDRRDPGAHRRQRRRAVDPLLPRARDARAPAMSMRAASLRSRGAARARASRRRRARTRGRAPASRRSPCRRAPSSITTRSPSATSCGSRCACARRSARR